MSLRWAKNQGSRCCTRTILLVNVKISPQPRIL